MNEEMIQPNEDTPLEGEVLNPEIQGIEQRTIENVMEDSFFRYSMSVIIDRALPDVRDGLKPVHRRILYAMYREGILSNKRFVKCAGVVGEVLKRGVRGDERVQGHGIGLSIICDIVASYGGEMKVGRSEQLGGASFEVRLPPLSG